MWQGTSTNRYFLGIIGAVTFIVMARSSMHFYKSRYAIVEARPTPATFASLNIMKRNSFLRKRCKVVNSWPDFHRNESVKATVFMDKNIHLMACENHKVGTSTLSNIMKKLSNDTTKGTHYRVYNLTKALSAATINKLPYTSVMFVRNPLERLVSAYKENYSVRKFQGKRVNFTTYLTDILARRKSHIHPHYMTYYEKCRPCDVNYSYFGTLETFDADMRLILNSLHLNLDAIPHSNTKNTRRFAGKMIREVPAEIIQRIWERYEVDYYLFAYPHP